MSMRSMIGRGRGGDFEAGVGKSFLGKTITRLRIGGFSDSNRIFFPDTDPNYRESISPDGPIMAIVRAVKQEATIVAHAPSPMGHHAGMTWDFYVEGNYEGATGSNADSNEASLATRVQAALQAIPAISVFRLNTDGSRPPANADGSYPTQTFLAACFTGLTCTSGDTRTVALTDNARVEYDYGGTDAVQITLPDDHGLVSGDRVTFSNVVIDNNDEAPALAAALNGGGIFPIVIGGSNLLTIGIPSLPSEVTGYIDNARINGTTSLVHVVSSNFPRRRRRILRGISIIDLTIRIRGGIEGAQESSCGH